MKAFSVFFSSTFTIYFHLRYNSAVKAKHKKYYYVNVSLALVYTQILDELINALKVLLTNHELYTLPLKIYEFIK